MSLELLIKAKSLADEARTIREQERKLKAKGLGPSREYQSLHLHRTGIVRDEARLTHLARAYLRKMPYTHVERTVRAENRLTEGDHKRIAAMVSKYGEVKVEWTEVWGWVEAQPIAA